MAIEAASLLPVRAQNYQVHDLHSGERIWTETNCYIDLWIELLAALGLDPTPAGACALSADFLGDQWTFLKYPPEDLRALYGIDVAEMSVWKPVLDHVMEQLTFGRLVTVEVDSWWLPDTAGVSYRIDHTKSTIVPNVVEPGARRMEYFHNAGLYVLEGDDFEGIFNLKNDDPWILAPYMETVDLTRLDRAADLGSIAIELAGEHLRWAPEGNPVARLGEQIQRDVPWLQEAGLDAFHLYAFALVRQCGFTAELAADFSRWLRTTLPNTPNADRLEQATAEFGAVAQGMKSLQLRLARAARGRDVDVSDTVAALAGSWGVAMDAMRTWHGTA